MISIKEIVIEAENPHGLARFWAGLLEGFAVRAYDDEEVERLAGISAERPRPTRRSRSTARV